MQLWQERHRQRGPERYERVQGCLLRDQGNAQDKGIGH